MNIERPYIRDRGILQSERVVLRIVAPTNIGEFAVFRAATADAAVTTDVSRVFWFPDGQAKSGDIVVLYTKEGINKERANKGGYTSHFFYWGLNQAIWEDPDVAAVVVHIDEWRSTLTAEDEKTEQSSALAEGA
jgi:hypothetical protein